MFNKKPFLFAGISGIAVIFVPLIFSLIGYFVWQDFFAFLSSFFSFIFSLFFMYGFYYLGLKYKNKFLSVASLIGLFVFVFLYFLLASFGVQIDDKLIQINSTITQQQIVLDNLSASNVSIEQITAASKEMDSNLWNHFASIIVPFLFLLIIFTVLFVLFDIGLIRLSKVKYAKATGILGLAGLGLMLSLFGIFMAFPIFIAYYVLIIVILFNQAKKFKEIR